MESDTNNAAVALWRRLDTVGTDAARLSRNGAGWLLAGSAVFLHDKKPARLNYDVELNPDWTTSRGTIRGFIGGDPVDQTILRDAGGWSMNGSKVPGLAHLHDLDLGFTPATNLPYLRRANLAMGEAIDRAVAWWEPGVATLQNLPQHYQRHDELTYWYESPTVSYEAVLEFSANGFARNYPQLWVMESE